MAVTHKSGAGAEGDAGRMDRTAGKCDEGKGTIRMGCVYGGGRGEGTRRKGERLRR